MQKCYIKPRTIEALVHNLPEQLVDDVRKTQTKINNGVLMN